MSARFNTYIGKAGHLAVMAEFLMRGWNVAIPEVDVGDDIFVVKDDTGTLRRVQVKTARTSLKGAGSPVTFSLKARQLFTNSPILVHYVFVVRIDDQWGPLVIIRQDMLQRLVAEKGRTRSANITLRLLFMGRKVMLGQTDITNSIRDFADFPIIAH